MVRKPKPPKRPMTAEERTRFVIMEQIRRVDPDHPTEWDVNLCRNFLTRVGRTRPVWNDPAIADAGLRAVLVLRAAGVGVMPDEGLVLRHVAESLATQETYATTSLRISEGKLRAIQQSHELAVTRLDDIRKAREYWRDHHRMKTD